MLPRPVVQRLILISSPNEMGAVERSPGSLCAVQVPRLMQINSAGAAAHSMRISIG